MQVRLAVQSELNTILDLCKNLIHESPVFSKQRFNERTTTAFINHQINHDSVLVVLDEYENIIGAAICATCIDWRTGDRLAIEQGIYVLPEYRNTKAGISLVRGFKEWAVGHEVDRIQIGTMSGIESERVVKLYEHLGFELVGYSLEQEI